VVEEGTIGVNIK